MTVIDLKPIIYYSHSISSRIIGVANVYWENPDAPNKEHLRVDSSTDFMVIVPPEIAHTEEPSQTQAASFLASSGYSDPTHPAFGRNIWTDKLGEIRRSPDTRDVIEKAYSWLSLVAEPTAIGAVTVDIAKQLNSLPYGKLADSPPYNRFAVPPNKQTTIDTAVLFEPFRNGNDLWKSFLRVDCVGNIEYAESQNVFLEFNGYRLFQYVTLVGLCWQFQFLAKEILEQHGYNSGVRFTINIVGTRDTILAQFAEGKGVGGNKWISPFERDIFGREESSQTKMPQSEHSTSL
jgi:hypothetical protein